MLLLGLKNVSTQSVATDGFVNLGNVYRKYCKKCNGITTFSTNGESVTLNQSGIYHITITAIASGDVAGDVTIQLLEDGTPIVGVLSTQTITTATTELRTFTIDYYILVSQTNVLNGLTTIGKTISLQNIGVDATFESVIFNVEKVV